MKQFNLLGVLLAVFIMLAGCSGSSSAQTSKEDPKPQQSEPAQQETTNDLSKNTTTPSSFSKEILKDTREGIDPARIQIPAIGVDTAIDHVGLKANGEMDVTEDFTTTFWYDKGYKPGEPGNAVIGGHIDSKKGPAIFYDLKKLNPGDEINVWDKEGQKRTFEVIQTKTYPYDKAPLKEIFGFSYNSNLNLITCTGKFNHDAHNFSHRLVVYTQLKTS